MKKFIFVALMMFFTASAMSSHRHHHRHDGAGGLYVGAMFGPFYNNLSSDIYGGGALKAGLQLDDFLAIEGQAGGSSWTEFDNGLYQERVAGYTGLYLKASLPFDRHRLYGMVGYSNFEFESKELVGSTPTTETWFHDSFTDEGASVGFGIDFFVNPYSAVSIQWMNFLSNEVDELNQWSVGFTHHF